MRRVRLQNVCKYSTRVREQSGLRCIETAGLFSWPRRRGRRMTCCGSNGLQMCRGACDAALVAVQAYDQMGLHPAQPSPSGQRRGQRRGQGETISPALPAGHNRRKGASGAKAPRRTIQRLCSATAGVRAVRHRTFPGVGWRELRHLVGPDAWNSGTRPFSGSRVRSGFMGRGCTHLLDLQHDDW